MLRTATALVTGAAVATSASGARLAHVGANDTWQLSPAEDDILNWRPHVLIQPTDGAALKLPIVVLEGTNYTASMTRVVGTHADPADPMRPFQAPERRLTLGVSMRPDFMPRSKQRDKVMLTFFDENRTRDLHADILAPEPRYIAFDVNFSPTYELSPNSHYVIHFQALQVGMHKDVLAGAGEPPFSIRVRGTTPRNPNKMGPIDLRLERRWWPGRGLVQEQVLTADGLDNLQRGLWYRIVLRLVPGYDDGQIVLWHWNLSNAYNRCDSPANEWRVPWGYKPVPSGDANEDARRRSIQFGLGIYRYASDTTQRLQFRNIRYGTTFDDVVPGRSC